MSESRMPRYAAKTIRACEKILETGTKAEQLAAGQTIAGIFESQSKLAPFRAALAERIKELRFLREDHKKVIRELETAKSQLTEQATAISNLMQQRDNLKDDLSRLGDDLRGERQTRVDGETSIRKLRRQAETVEADMTKLRFSLQTIASRFKADEEFGVQLFFEHGDAMSPEVYSGLGWTPERLEKWLATWRRYKDAPTEEVIDLIHRGECVCQHEKPTPKRPTDDLEKFLRGLLNHRGVAVDQGISRLVATHQENWFKLNRVSFADPPLSQRHLTPLARVVQWGAD